MIIIIIRWRRPTLTYLYYTLRARNRRPRRVGGKYAETTNGLSLFEHSPAAHIGTGVSAAAERVGPGSKCFFPSVRPIVCSVGFRKCFFFSPFLPLSLSHLFTLYSFGCCARVRLSSNLYISHYTRCRNFNSFCPTEHNNFNSAQSNELNQYRGDSQLVFV